MYSNVVLGIEHHHFEDILNQHKDDKGVSLDTELDAEDWQGVVGQYMNLVRQQLGHDFPQDPEQQLWGAIGAVFGSWMNQRAITYRRLRGIPESWGAAVNVQAMVFGSMGETSATAALRIAGELANEGLITRKEAGIRSDPGALDQLLHPTIDPNSERKIIA